MNRRIDFTQLGGFPATQYTFDYMQQAYTQTFAGLGAAFGDSAIISGCIVTGNFISDGWVCVNKEILPFTGGSVVIAPDTAVIIVETKESRLFADNSTKDVYFARSARIGVGVGSVLWSKFKRIDADPWKTGDIKEIIVTNQYLTDNFNAAGIGINERIGWALLDGQGGRPDSRGRVTVGINTADTDFDIPGKTGGNKTQLIQKANLPAIKLDVPIPTNATSDSTAGDGNIVLGNGGPDAHPGPTLKTETIGSGVGLNIVQPYLVTVKIIKL